jgi:hypothetical protein
MALVARHPASATILLAAVAAVAAVFAFARPQYHPVYESRMIDLAKQEYVSPEAVRAAFVQAGLQLPYTSHFANITTLSADGPAADSSGLYVYVGGRTGQLSWGPKFGSAYDERFANLAVHYGGSDGTVLERAKTAVAALRD